VKSDNRISEWGIDRLDIGAYLERINHPHVKPSVDSLHSLHEAHAHTIPFENIDILLGKPRELGLDALKANLVDRKRGGNCFELALLFAAALERLGFTVRRCIARARAARSGPRTHMMLIVHAHGLSYLADVGLGSGMLRPVPIYDGATVQQSGREYRLTRDGMLWTLAQRQANGWKLLHKFDDQPQSPADYEILQFWALAHPRSFRVILPDHGFVRRLSVGELSVEHSDGHIEHLPIAVDDLPATLSQLGVVLDADDLATVRQLWRTRSTSSVGNVAPGSP
jgi:N-hydroxyarylamine O-acetyltransferase